MTRLLGISFGLLTHALFALAVWHIFWFLRGSQPAGDSPPLWWLIDIGLALQQIEGNAALDERLGHRNAR